MLLGLFRVLTGFVVACFVAAAMQVAFAVLPLADRPTQPKLIELVLLTATHFAVFSAPFGLIAAILGEWQGLRSRGYYLFTGLATGAAGFLVQFTAESGGPTVYNPYAVTAFLLPGLIGGFAYWLVAGRQAGGRSER